jgi:glycerol-3-phosphate acyltransferase PlsY
MNLALFDGRVLFWFISAFLCGSLPFALWITKLAGADVRLVGDHNPGATNALKAGGWKSGLAALLLDTSKAAVPVGLAYQIFGIRGTGMVAIALAPMLGHAFSPFLHFKGGKALATTLGVWIGLTIWDVPLVALAGIIAWFLLLRNSGWAVALTLAGMAVYLYLFRPEIFFYSVLGFQTLLLLWKHRDDLRQMPKLYKSKNSNQSA